ncbi:Inner spore coat protein H [Archangium minus]|uniref:Inner spore coat protein H n=1 Tax=Archangium minus TaxID=83450 RepID=A0ABY9WZJ9_9BACT|nr:Inner spore coat protein H [Archangium minus]
MFICLTACGGGEGPGGTPPGVADSSGESPPFEEAPPLHPPQSIPDGEPPPGPPVQSGPFQLPPLQVDLPSYDITIAPELLAEFDRRPGLEAQAATFTFQGKSQPVGLRLRGSSARSFPKRSWRIEFPEGVKFDGRRKHNLIAEYQDSTLMVEKLGYDLLEALGVPAPRARYVRLTINGVYQGVYLDLERVDKDFLDHHNFDDDDASIYRCGARDCELKPWRMDYQTEWDKKTNEDVGPEDIHALEDAICHTPEPSLVRTLEERMELERYLRYLVTDALISNYVIQDSRSYFIHDRVTGRWSYVPWDVNNSVATWWPTYGLEMEPIADHPIFNFSLADPWITRLYELRKTFTPGLLPTFSNLNTRIAFNPELRERTLRLMERALDEVFNPEVLHPRLEQMHALLLPHLKEDPYITRPDKYRQDGLAQFQAGLPYMKHYITRRHAHIRQQIAAYRARSLGLALSAFNPREGWVELHNYGLAPVSTHGMVLTKDLRRALAPNVPERTLAPGGTVRFTAAELGITTPPPAATVTPGGPVGFPARGEIGLFNGKSIVGVIDLLYYGELPAGRFYARNAQEPARWEIR